MSQTVALIVATVAGLFSVLTVFLNWQFTRRNLSQQGLTQFEEKRYQDLSDLYVQTYELIERAMASQLIDAPSPDQSQFSINSAKMRLLAPSVVYDKYFEVTSKIEQWSALHAKTKPKRMQMGDQTITMLQSPDPTLKYKQPAESAYKEMHEAILELAESMRADLERHVPHHSSHLKKGT